MIIRDTAVTGTRLVLEQMCLQLTIEQVQYTVTVFQKRRRHHWTHCSNFVKSPVWVPEL